MTLTRDERSAHWSLYALIGCLAAAVLVYGVAEQIYDTNFYALWEATALLAGDHPYRDFYQWGSPLLTAFSALAQWLVGNRLIGEFVIGWSFIVAGILMGFHLALRLSRSVAWSLVTSLLAVVILGSTPTFQFPKLFFYPIAVWVAWWYMDRPSVRRAAMVGFVTALAFLYRHDHGVYIGVASVVAFALARVAVPASRSLRSATREGAVYFAVAAVIVAPWAIVVQRSEGMIDYIRTRGEWGRKWSPRQSPYLSLLEFNPVRVLASNDSATADDDGNEGRRSLLLPRERALRWLFQITLLLPLCVLVSAGVDVLGHKRRRELVSLDTCRIILAGVLAIVASRLLREDGYFVVVLPLTAAFGALLLATPHREKRRILTAILPAWMRGTWRVTERALAFGLLVITTSAAFGSVDRDLYAAGEVEELAPAFRRLMASPPIDGHQPALEAHQLDRAGWLASDADEKQQIMLRYMHDCTRAGDRILVTGSTPFHVGYYTERPIAGGHLFWHHQWRSDPYHERQSLALIGQQSVPFAFSSHDPILDDFTAYPSIREYLVKHYVELEGSDGRLLVDSRRQSTTRFGALGFPCFR